MEQLGVLDGNFAPSFSLIFLSIFVHISGSISLGRSLWSRHHWIDLFPLQKSSIDDANFGQKWQRQKWKKGQASSRAVTGGTGVNKDNNNTLFTHATSRSDKNSLKHVRESQWVNKEWTLKIQNFGQFSCFLFYFLAS